MPSTRSSDPKPPKTHILDFFYDDDNGCAFTARINDERFHIILDPAQLMTKDGTESQLLTEYLELLRLVRLHDQSEERLEAPPDDGTKSTDRSEDRDSGVDVSADDGHEASMKTTHDHVSSSPSTDPALDVQNWILRCFGEEVPQHPDDKESKEKFNVEQWYEVAVKYYEVRLSDDEEHVEPVLVDDYSHLQGRVDDLLPHLCLPKKLRELSIPWVAGSEVTVLAEHDDPPPVHPSLVRATLPDREQQTYFFKPVDPTQPQPPKREIELLHRIHSKGLAKEFLVPRIEALVGWKNSKTEAMGYLLSVIDDPVPLTKLLDSEVDESKRQRWAKETEKVIKILHENGIVWGDAKADNFLVDKENKLWIIDFGGSYTEGWVDSELNETVEGDDMALEKIVNGLKDPDNMTADFNEEQDQKAQDSQRKRKRGDEDSEYEGGETEHKRRKSDG
jgi:hypothetical protein